MCVYRVLKLENDSNIIQKNISTIEILIQHFNMLFWVASSSRIVRWLDYFELAVFTLVAIFSSVMQLFMKTVFSRRFNGTMGTGSCGYVHKVAPPYYCLCFSDFTKAKLNLNRLFENLEFVTAEQIDFGQPYIECGGDVWDCGRKTALGWP